MSYDVCEVCAYWGFTTLVESLDGEDESSVEPPVARPCGPLKAVCAR